MQKPGTKNKQSQLCEGIKSKSKFVHTRGSKSRRKTSLQNCQIVENLLGNIKIFPSQNPIFLNGFPAFRFLQWLSAFFNGFLLSSMAFCFLQRLSDFFNGIPLSSTMFRFLQQLSAFFNGFPLSSTAFHFFQRLSAFFNGFPLFSMAFCFLQWHSAFFNGFLLSSTAFCRRGLLISLLFLIKKYQMIRSHINGNSIALRGSTYAVAY
jgi:hypothetical protein